MKQKPFVFIVDDEYSIRKTLTSILKTRGYRVKVFETGKAAVEAARDQALAAALIDLRLGDLSGLEVMRRIRSTSTFAECIMITGHASQTSAIEAVNYGAYGYIEKPFKVDQLLVMIQRAIEKSEAEKTLKEVLELQHKIISESPIGISIYDETGQCALSNNACADLMGTNRSQMLDQNFNTLDTWKKNGLYNKAKLTIEKKAKQRHEVSLKTNGDKKVSLDCHLVPFNSEKSPRLLLMTNDITRRIEIEDELKERKEELTLTLEQLKNSQAQLVQSEKMASIGQLASGVAHEINNPSGYVSSNLKTLADYQTELGTAIINYRELVNGIKTNTNNTSTISKKVEQIIALEDEMDMDYVLEDVDELIKESREGIDRIKQIVLDLKDFAHPGNDKMKDVDINKGINSTLNVVHNELKYKVTVKKELGDLPMIKGYPQQLNQVFMNIIVNAAQAIEEKGDIRIATTPDNGGVQIMISDTGSGIPKDHIPKLFDPFFTTKEVGQGTGLGLNVVYNIVKKHNGTIDVKSKPGKGTTFLIRIPDADEESKASRP